MSHQATSWAETVKVGGVDMSTQWPDPDYPTLDHTVPICRGGTDADDNLVLAHWLCNVQKRDR